MVPLLGEHLLFVFNLFLLNLLFGHLIEFVSLKYTLVLRQLLYFLFRMLFDVQQPQRVFNEPTFDDFVHVRVVVETWTLVDLQQPGLELLIEHDVEAQDLKALPIILVARFAGTRLVIMFQMR
jgi:hypothetical protein